MQQKTINSGSSLLDGKSFLVQQNPVLRRK